MVLWASYLSNIDLWGQRESNAVQIRFLFEHGENSFDALEHIQAPTVEPQKEIDLKPIPIVVYPLGTLCLKVEMVENDTIRRNRNVEPVRLVRQNLALPYLIVELSPQRLEARYESQ